MLPVIHSRGLQLLLVVSFFLSAWTSAGAAPAPDRAVREQARARGKLIRTALHVHKELRAAKVSLPLPPSEVLKPELAQAKVYGDSWTCRRSSRVLNSMLRDKNLALSIDSAGPNAFYWGKEGWVSFHYYLVDSVSRPRVLVDPTASTNFARDVAPDGLLRSMLVQVGAERNLQRAALRVAERIQRAQPDRALVLANGPEIRVYKEALDRAAQLQSSISRNSQLLGQ